MIVQYQPDSPDNKSIREQSEELKKLNISTLILTFIGIMVVLIKQ